MFAEFGKCCTIWKDQRPMLVKGQKRSTYSCSWHSPPRDTWSGTACVRSHCTDTCGPFHCEWAAFPANRFVSARRGRRRRCRALADSTDPQALAATATCCLDSPACCCYCPPLAPTPAPAPYCCWAWCCLKTHCRCSLAPPASASPPPFASPPPSAASASSPC